MSQPEELGLCAQVLDVVPPGPIHRNRRSAVAKFSHRVPNFRDPVSSFSLIPDPRASTVAELAARKKEETVSKLRQQQQQQQQPLLQRSGTDVKVPLVLEQRDASAAGGAPAAVFKGVPEAGGGANMEGPPLHYVLFRSGNQVTAFPAEQWFAFKPHVDRRGLLDSVTAANAAAGRQPPSTGNGAGKGAAPLDFFAMRLVPKSQRLEKQRQEEEAKERQEQVAAGRLLPLAGAVDDELGRGFGAGGGRLKRFVDEDELEEELFGNDDEEEEGTRFGGKGGKGGKKGRGRALKTADGEELGEDEVPEDLYAGPGADEDLRPEKPEEAEDWEHEFAPDDDDQDQGQDEVYDDDPGLRKKLGIEGDDEDEEEEADEQAKKLKKLGDPDDSDQEEEEEERKKKEEEAKRQQAAAGGSGATGAAEEDEPADEDEEDLDELDEMEEEPKPPPVRPAPAPPVAAKPPVAPGITAAAAAGTKRKAPEESRPATEVGKRARTATPPPPAQAAGTAAVQAKPAAAAAAGTAAAAATGPASSQPQRPAGQLAGGGAAAAAPSSAITAEEVVKLLRSQPNGIMPFQDFTRYFAKRTTTPELRAGLKSLTVSLCKSSKNEAGQLLVSLKK
ncbi:hypothetical protein Vretimale_976 [Volvox reticuliferus]|uniref:Transcription initiation factor IIF subunit alpha n=1 Tax=Volvox reticuliferus TaxID=1737510 RepID=A0A8J4D6U9_9CHLO|nr:hypothetical protein Vretifemale_10514 [Volvox reticuliferus]GIL94895.1 hypothetical protein Vretimale_976 [Volvox reticuliferus]